MTPDAITPWLASQRRRGMIRAALYAAATLAGGTFVLGLTFYFAFVAFKLVLLSAFPTAPTMVTIASGLLALVAGTVIFVDAVLARRDDMSFLALWFLREYISIGPRLILEGWPYVGRVRRFARMDVATSARVLRYLATKAVPAFRTEVLRVVPEATWTRLTIDLQLLHGVIFFRPDGLRVILTTPLRLELRARMAVEATVEPPEPEPQPTPVAAPHRLSPAEILGVQPAASLAQIKAAYRTRIKECHPDRFAGMDEHSRSLAEEWTKSLNAAYELLVAETRGRKPT